MKKNLNDILKVVGTVFAFLLVYRLFGQSGNFTPIFASAILVPYITNNNYIKYLAPLSLMFISDLFLGLYPEAPVVYTCIAFATWLSTVVSNKYYAVLGSIGVWHVLVNTMTASISHGYGPFTVEALTFDIKLLVSTLLYVGLYDYGKKLWQTRLQGLLLKQ